LPFLFSSCIFFHSLGVICNSTVGHFSLVVPMVPGVQLDRVNRRRRVRQKVHAPAYASFSGGSKGIMLELHEVLNISENGIAIQCTSQLEPNRPVQLCLDLSGDAGQLCTTALVAWSDGTGRAGLSLPNLSEPSARRLREWLFFNAMVSAANAGSSAAALANVSLETPRPSYTDTLTAVSAVQGEAEALGADLDAVLQLVATRARNLLRASGAAIALVSQEADTLACRASAGECAPPVGAALHAGSGFSGECVRVGRALRCDDSETDPRVDRQSCGALGIRSMLAAPIRTGEKVCGLIEVFSPRPNAFDDHAGVALQRLAETVFTAINRAAYPQAQSGSRVARPAAPDSTATVFAPSPGSVLFASEAKPSAPEEATTTEPNPEETSSASVHLPRSLLILLICAAAAIFLAMGWVFAPWIQQQIRTHARHAEQTVFASSPATTSPTPAQSAISIDTATLEQLQQMAAQGNAAAENALGLRYATGDGVPRDEKEAAEWFTSAAEHGSVVAQSKLGQLYWSGRGVPASLNQAYFWTVLARAGGQEGSKTLAPIMASRMSGAQRAAIEQQAADWYRDHEPNAKPSPAR
jgi:TPR repeat protein/putative methionine-R-sulfoxide reductase with GAF domain